MLDSRHNACTEAINRFLHPKISAWGFPIISYFLPITHMCMLNKK